MNKHGINRHASALIDLNAICHNYRLLRNIAGKRLIAVIKADAYGHGAIEVAQALTEADALAVSSVSEAVAVREAGINSKILVLGGFIDAGELQSCIAYQLDPVIHQHRHLEYLYRSQHLAGLQVWLKVDSGMGRLGCAPDQVGAFLEQLNQLPELGQIRLITHLAQAEDMESDFSAQQLAVVQALGLERYEWSIANSAGILSDLDSGYSWARAGIALYGVNPMSNRKQLVPPLIPAMQMKSRVLAMNAHRQGDVIGYGSSYTCPLDMNIAVVAAGYADGYPRLKVDTAQVSIGGHRCNIVGRISMDMLTVDISPLERVEIGDEVVLFGESPHVNDIADASNTISYEILCNVGGHVKRQYRTR